MKPFLLGITGGIGSGKSSVSRLLASFCRSPLIDVDECCRHLLEVGQPGWQSLRERFSGQFLLENGRVDRAGLRERLFADPVLRRQVDALLHPLARQAMRREAMRHDEALVLVEIPLLYEAGWQDEVDAVLAVYARPGVQCCRVMRRDGVSRRSAMRAMAAQMDLGEKAQMADYVIDNGGSWAETREQTVALGRELSAHLSAPASQESA
jgi:dephospho-CoA kinase